MKVKRVNRYYCEYCKKSGCSARHMRHHEERCTMNPGRKCGMCGLIDAEQQPMETLLAVLPDPALFWKDWAFTYTAEIQKAVADLREIADGCPACILAALLQKGIPVGAIYDFNFREECDGVWARFNEEKYGEEPA
uniref:Uncharacterized protein n=1 Tax=viral metagenome TaxID=1070528 RepID=A0A6M3K226_9ZZZZ